MKKGLFRALLSTVALVLLFGCGGDGGSGASSGTVSMDITDAKPMLPEGTKNVRITFEEVLVHRAGGGWISLPLVQAPYTIDLLQFYDGSSTELVPPAELESADYTQIRIVVSSATITIDDGASVNDYSLTIPSENLKTDKNFSFNVQDGGAVDIIVDFDLSKSIVVTGPSGTPSYELKPVLHIVHTSEAATIHGSIADDSFDNKGSDVAIVTVISDNNGEEYTKVIVSRTDTGDPAEFSIFWLVPNQDYTAEIDMDPDLENGPEFIESVYAVDLQPGDAFELNSGNAIILP